MTLQELKQALRYIIFTDNLRYSVLSDTFYIYEGFDSNVVLGSLQADNWNSLLNQYRTYIGTVEHNDLNLPLMQFLTYGEYEAVELPLTISRQIKMLSGAIGLCPLNDSNAVYTYDEYLKILLDKNAGKSFEAVIDVKAGEKYYIKIEGKTFVADDAEQTIQTALLDYGNNVKFLDIDVTLKKHDDEPWKVICKDTIFTPAEDGKARIAFKNQIIADGVDVSKTAYGVITITDSAGNVLASSDESK